MTNIKCLRKSKKLSQQQLADSIGIKQRAYSYYETGQSSPPLDVVIKLAKYYQISIDVLVGYTLDHILKKIE